MKRIAATITASLGLMLALAGPARAADVVEGASFTQLLVTFTGTVPTQVTIDWADGTTQPSAVVTQPDGSGQVSGTHTYAKLGSYRVKVSDAANPDVYQTTDFSVKDAPVTAQGGAFKTGAAPGGVVVATVTDANPLGTAADFSAQIDWGDGSVSAGALVPRPGSPGQYDVTGSHTYPDGASYLAGVTIKSTDFGDANVSVQTSVDGAPDPSSAASGKGKLLDFGPGDSPSLVVEEDGTADLAWAIRAPGRTGDAVVFCRLPRGARACATKRTFQVDALTPPKILRDRNGVLRIVVSYNGVLQLGGGTLVMSSADNGGTWSNAFFPVNTGLFQGSIIDAALSLDGRVLYALFGDFIPGDKSQIFATIGLDRPVTGREFDPGNVGGVPTYSARSVAVLADGRAVIVGYDTRAPENTVPRAAIRVMADASGNNAGQPWTPIRAGEVNEIAASLASGGASVLGAQACDKGVQISPLRGLTLGAPRPLAGDRSLACNTSAQDLTYDAAGGRHAVWLSDEDGCQGKGPYSSDGICIIYRHARPGGDFGPKSTITKLKLASANGLSVAAGRDGEGWVTWRDLSTESIKVKPTETDAEAPVTPNHRIALALAPSAECSKSGKVTVRAQVVGPSKDRPAIRSVDWSTTQGLLPRSASDASAPFSRQLSVDRRPFRGLSSTGTIVFSMTVRAKVRYRSAGKTQTARLEQVVSFFCGIKFDKVK